MLLLPPMGRGGHFCSLLRLPVSSDYGFISIMESRSLSLYGYESLFLVPLVSFVAIEGGQKILSLCALFCEVWENSREHSFQIIYSSDLECIALFLPNDSDGVLLWDDRELPIVSAYLLYNRLKLLQQFAVRID